MEDVFKKKKKGFKQYTGDFVDSPSFKGSTDNKGSEDFFEAPLLSDTIYKKSPSDLLKAQRQSVGTQADKRLKNHINSDKILPNPDSETQTAKIEQHFERDQHNAKSEVPDDYSSLNRQKVQIRESEKKEILEYKKKEKKAAEKREKKEIKKAAAATALLKVIETKKNIYSEFTDDASSSGEELLAAGNVGATKTITSTVAGAIKTAAVKLVSGFGKIACKILAAIIGLIGPYLAVVFLVIVLFVAILGGIAAIFEENDEGEDSVDSEVSYTLNTGISGTYYATPYTSSEINELIEMLRSTYPSMSSSQEQTLRSALSCVGAPYNQHSHGNHNDNVWDCSELAYCAWLSGGIDISCGGIYTAAEECRAMVNSGHTLTGSFVLQPGDLIFYGGKDNGRFLGVYHVAIYLGNINGVDRMVEAYGSSRGVIVSDIRNTGSIVNISRPYA